MLKRVVITGIGTIAPNGLNKDDFWKNLTEGNSFGKEIDRFDTRDFYAKTYAPVDNFDASQYDFSPAELKNLSRAGLLVNAASQGAVSDSGLDFNLEDPSRISVVVGNAIGGTTVGEPELGVMYRQGPQAIQPNNMLTYCPVSYAGNIAAKYGIKGYTTLVSTGCTSGVDSVGLGFESILSGEHDICIVGGTEAPLTPYVFNSFCRVTALAAHNETPGMASRPFSLSRNGFLLGEGAASLILEEYEHAKKRNATIYAEVGGWGSGMNAYHMTAPDPTGRSNIYAIEKAIKQAGIGAQEIDYINAHGSSTKLNDKIETMIFTKIMGDHAYKVPISSTKSMIGHPLGAAGVLETAACALSIKNQVVHPTINYMDNDPECDLDYVPNDARDAKVDVVLKNACGFSGMNSSMILKRI
ncbi:MAG: beta-ketoacyl-[acyl-carrier-protein] synthase family protein [Bacteroidales bacterium]|nr:beta-ketoacyl-[acyl-carrier-protein] synthase family protein [Bacteroidales bacterium]